MLSEFVAAEYAKLSLIPPYLQPGNHQFGYGINFAAGGAGALDETYPGVVINLNTQLTYFKDVEKELMHKVGEEKATLLLSKALFLVNIGTTDYGNLVKYSGSHEEYVEMVMGNLTVVIKVSMKGKVHVADRVRIGESIVVEEREELQSTSFVRMQVCVF
ncbi:hypothetical protein RJ639_001599 [Escallonia herrerae]|uniref:Uncharacterized protein n=1 Tax=Escallonia herrerae TaxID=1293975 RepID=A0AA88XBK9_9ASTE|nr:hypothetical protein RJ639_001599 [Escallonia herrerae]